jgi:hypothetical protein
MKKKKSRVGKFRRVRRGNPIGPKTEMFSVPFHVYELILPGLRLSPLIQNQNEKDEQVTFRIHDPP